MSKNYQDVFVVKFSTPDGLTRDVNFEAVTCADARQQAEDYMDDFDSAHDVEIASIHREVKLEEDEDA